MNVYAFLKFERSPLHNLVIVFFLHIIPQVVSEAPWILDGLL
jgi:hypothetical protein